MPPDASRAAQADRDSSQRGMPAGDMELPAKLVERSASSGSAAAKPLLPDGSAGFKAGNSCGRYSNSDCVPPVHPIPRRAEHGSQAGDRSVITDAHLLHGLRRVGCRGSGTSSS